MNELFAVQSNGICSQSNKLCDNIRIERFFFAAAVALRGKKKQLEFLPSESHKRSADANQFNNRVHSMQTHI